LQGKSSLLLHATKAALMERQADMTHLKGNNALGKEALYYDKAPLSFWERQSQTKESQWVIKAFCRSNQGRGV